MSKAGLCIFIAFSGLFWLLAFSQRTAAQTTTASTSPTTAPSTAASDFDVHEWAVFVYDGLANRLNANGVVTSSLPPFIPTHRTASPDGVTTDSPVGVLRFTGRFPDSLDVSLDRGGGACEASWPRAQERTTGLLWRGLTLHDQPAGDPMADADPASIVGRLRSTASAYAVDGKSQCEPFLLYDVDLPFQCPLKVQSSPGAVRLSNTGTVSLHDVAVFRQQSSDWATLAIDELPTAPPAAASPSPSATTRPTTRASSQASTQPTTRASTEAPAPPLSVVPGIGPDRLASDWVHAHLSDAQLSNSDQAIITTLIVQHGFDGQRPTAIYRLDTSDMDRLLPLEILPQPRRITRVGIVLLRNIDPAAGSDVDDEITRLGDPVWARREAASKALATLGSAATAKLKTAVSSPDPEIGWRAERLLAAASAHQP